MITPVDLSKIRIPGSELKEALVPTTGIWGQVELTKAASIEGFYLTNHDKVRLDPKGSYFSSNDFASDDATRVSAYAQEFGEVPPRPDVAGLATVDRPDRDVRHGQAEREVLLSAHAAQCRRQAGQQHREQRGLCRLRALLQALNQ